MEGIASYIQDLYTKEAGEKILRELSSYIKDLPHYGEQSQAWYKNSILYFLYPDSIKIDDKPPLRSVTSYLHHVKDLGCDGVHLLPFLDSPMRDKGYDVRDYYKVREGLGGMEALLEVKKEADKLGIHLFMDLVFNHVSSEHEWFIKAQEGDNYYRDFFIHTKEAPQFLGKVVKNSSVFAKYLVNGEKTLVNVTFPESSGELPHWVQGKDGYWYYHTFYPHQIDLNWQNPEVFLYFAKVLLYWASLGFNFRFDAIPFIGKAAYKHLNTHNSFTHHLVATLNLLAQKINPYIVCILEVNEKLHSDIEYFGSANVEQAQLLYNFQLTASVWASLVEENATYVYKHLQEDQDIPVHAQWILFLRNHDELNLSSLPHHVIEDVHKKLLPYGKGFSDRLDIVGRTYPLLGSSEKRILMAYFLLASLPGCLLLPYGDEFGMENVSESTLSLEEKKDLRNIARGFLTKEIMQSKKGKHIFFNMARIFDMRKVLKSYLNVWPAIKESQKGIFYITYQLGSSELVVLTNMTPKHKTIVLDTKQYQEVFSVNSVVIDKDKVHLGAFAGVWLQR